MAPEGEEPSSETDVEMEMQMDQATQDTLDTQDLLAANQVNTTDKPFRFDILLALLAQLGTGQEAIEMAERTEAQSVFEDGDSNAFHLAGPQGHLLAPHLHNKTVRQAVAQTIVTHMFLPLKAIAECSSVVPESDSDNDSDIDSDDGASPRTEPRQPRSDGDLIQTYIFPPSPLSNMRPAGRARDNDGRNGEEDNEDDNMENNVGNEDDENDENDENDEDDDAPESARHLAHYLTTFLDPNAVALLQRTAHDPDANMITLSRKWSDRFRFFEAIVQPRAGGSLDDPAAYASSDDLVIRSLATPSNADSEHADDAMSIHTLPGRPSRALLHLHAKIAFMLHMATAGPYIDRLLVDNTEREDLELNGTTMVGALMQLRLDGWYRSGGNRRRTRTRDNAAFHVLGSSSVWIDSAEFVEEQ